MTVRIWPADAVGGVPSYAGRALRQTLAPLAGFAPIGRPLGAMSGVRPGTPTATTVTASSSTWTVQPFAAFLDVEAAAAAGGYSVVSDDVVTGAVAAANATNPRVDIISVQVNDQAEGDGTSPTTPPFGQVIYTPGTAAASPNPPSAPARSLVLAQINVPASGGGTPTVTWVAPTFGAPPRMQALQRVGTALVNGSYTILTQYTKGVDTIGLTSPAAGTFAIPTGGGGTYKASATVSMDSNGASRCAAALYVNGASVNSMQIDAAATGAGGMTSIAIIEQEYQLNDGDQITLRAYINDNGHSTPGAGPYAALLRLERVA